MNFNDHDDDNDDVDDDSLFATKTSTNQKKPIPQWARSKFIWISHLCLIDLAFFVFLENELQIAICNQIYFHRNPSEIFGNSMNCSPSHIRTILHSMLPNVDLFDDLRCNSNKPILI